MTKVISRDICNMAYMHTGPFEIEIPLGSKPLQVGVKDGCVILWLESDTETPNERYNIHVIQTGNQVRGNWMYLGTITENCVYEEHLYAERKEVD